MEIKPEDENLAAEFPSTRFLIRAYSFGAILSLLSGITMKLDPVQVFWCIVLSWCFASGSIAMSFYLEQEDDAEELDVDDF